MSRDLYHTEEESTVSSRKRLPKLAFALAGGLVLVLGPVLSGAPAGATDDLPAAVVGFDEAVVTNTLDSNANLDVRTDGEADNDPASDEVLTSGGDSGVDDATVDDADQAVLGGDSISDEVTADESLESDELGESASSGQTVIPAPLPTPAVTPGAVAPVTPAPVAPGTPAPSPTPSRNMMVEPLPTEPGTVLDPGVVYGTDEYPMRAIEDSVISGTPLAIPAISGGDFYTYYWRWDTAYPHWASGHSNYVTDVEVDQCLRIGIGSGFTPSPDGYEYKWLRGGYPIPGANQMQYCPQPADIGQIIRAQLTATKAGFQSRTLVSNYSFMVWNGNFSWSGSTQQRLYITGSARVGQLLTANPNSNLITPAPAKYSYRWFRNGNPIPGASGKQYRLQAADAGKQIHVEVTIGRPGYNSMTKSSVLSNTVKFNTIRGGTVRVTGTPKVGETLRAVASGFTPSPAGWRYQWYRGGVAIPGATYSTYKPVAADMGKNIQARVTVSRDLHYDLTRSSAPINIIRPTVVAGGVSISGPTTVGSKLAANPSGFAPAPTSYTYQWFRNGYRIYGATAKTYILSQYDVGARITVEVSGKRTGYVNSPVVRATPTRAITR